MRPELDPALYAFCHQPDGTVPRGVTPLCLFQEHEGLTLVLPAEQARSAGLVPVMLTRRIILTVHSDLEAVGFMAEISAALARVNAPCNAIAAVFHDHIFIPEDRVEAALAALRQLQQTGASGPHGEVIYAVTVRVDPAVAAEWAEWMRTVHLPEVLATGCFTRCVMQREAEPATEDGRVTWVMEYHARSLEQLRAYRREHAPALQRSHTERYDGRFTAARSVRLVQATVAAPLATP
jgi:hypothetical protein